MVKIAPDSVKKLSRRLDRIEASTLKKSEFMSYQSQLFGKLNSVTKVLTDILMLNKRLAKEAAEGELEDPKGSPQPQTGDKNPPIKLQVSSTMTNILSTIAGAAYVYFEPKVKELFTDLYESAMKSFGYGPEAGDPSKDIKLDAEISPTAVDDNEMAAATKDVDNADIGATEAGTTDVQTDEVDNEMAAETEEANDTTKDQLENGAKLEDGTAVAEKLKEGLLEGDPIQAEIDSIKKTITDKINNLLKLFGLDQAEVTKELDATENYLNATDDEGNTKPPPAAPPAAASTVSAVVPGAPLAASTASAPAPAGAPPPAPTAGAPATASTASAAPAGAPPPAAPPAAAVVPAAGAGSPVQTSNSLTTTPLSKLATDFIAKQEGLPSNGKAYEDPPGSKKYSVGYGHQITPMEAKAGFIQAGDEKIPVTGKDGKDTVLNQAQAKKLLSVDMPRYEKVAKMQLGRTWDKLNEQQKAALTSYSYNTGSVQSLVRKGLIEAIDSGDMDKAASIIQNGIATAGGKPVAGLVTRRGEESQLFASVPGAVPPQVVAINNSTNTVATRVGSTNEKTEPISVPLNPRNNDLTITRANYISQNTAA